MLSELDASVTFMGFCRFVGNVFEFPIWLYGPQIMDKIGIENMLLLALCGNGVRLTGYGNLTKAEDAIFFETLHCCGFCVPYMTVTVFIGRLLPEDTKATMQTLLISVFAGLGTGFGAVLGGILTDFFLDRDIRQLFRVSGIAVSRFKRELEVRTYSVRLSLVVSRLDSV